MQQSTTVRQSCRNRQSALVVMINAEDLDSLVIFYIYDQVAIRYHGLLILSADDGFRSGSRRIFASVKVATIIDAPFVLSDAMDEKLRKTCQLALLKQGLRIVMSVLRWGGRQASNQFSCLPKIWIEEEYEDHAYNCCEFFWKGIL